jgi:hypothetical protein
MTYTGENSGQGVGDCPHDSQRLSETELTTGCRLVQEVYHLHEALLSSVKYFRPLHREERLETIISSSPRREHGSTSEFHCPLYRQIIDKT